MFMTTEQYLLIQIMNHPKYLDNRLSSFIKNKGLRFDVQTDTNITFLIVF